MMNFGWAPRWADALFSCLASVQGGGYLYVNVSANVYVELDRTCLRQNKNKIQPQRDNLTQKYLSKCFLSWTSASYSAHTQSALFIFNVVVSMFWLQSSSLMLTFWYNILLVIKCIFQAKAWLFFPTTASTQGIDMEIGCAISVTYF